MNYGRKKYVNNILHFNYIYMYLHAVKPLKRDIDHIGRYNMRYRM